MGIFDELDRLATETVNPAPPLTGDVIAELSALAARHSVPLNAGLVGMAGTGPNGERVIEYVPLDLQLQPDGSYVGTWRDPEADSGTSPA